MKQTICRAISILFVGLLLSSCGKSPQSDQTTTTTQKPILSDGITTTTTVTTEEDEPLKPQPDSNLLSIVQGGETAYSIVLPGNSLIKPSGNGMIRNLDLRKMVKTPDTVDTSMVITTAELIAALAEKTGVTIPCTNDAAVSAANAGEFEILIGLTDREESIALHKKLKERSFAVQTTDKKLVIVGYDDNMTVTAIRYCLSNYIWGVDSVGQVIQEGVFTIPANMEVTSPQEAQTPANTIHIGGSYTLKNAQVLTQINADGQYKVMQGAATDGVYLYYCIENQSLAAHESYIYKVDPATGKIITRSASLQLDHSNDMTYNPKLNQLIVVHNAPNRKLVSFVDVNTLEKIKTINIGYQIFCIAYNEKRDQYVVGVSGGQNFAIFDADFNFLREYFAPSTGYTTQGMTCDDNFLYFAQSGANVIVAYDWDGYQVAIIPIEFTNIETENICILGNDMYIGFYRSGNGGIVYRTTLTVK